MLSACGELMYCSTICFHRRRQSQPRKKLWTFFILAMSGSSLSLSYSDGKLKSGMDEVKRIHSVYYLFRPRYCFWGITLHSFFRVKSWKLIIIWRQSSMSLFGYFYLRVYLLSQLFYFNSQVFTMLCVLPLCCLFTLDNLFNLSTITENPKFVTKKALIPVVSEDASAQALLFVTEPCWSWAQSRHEILEMFAPHSK